MEEKPKQKKSRVGKYPMNKDKPQNQKGCPPTRGHKVATKEEHEDWAGVSLAPGEYNPMQQLTLQQMADKINSIDPNRKASKYANFVLAVKQIAVGVNTKDVEDMRRRFYAYLTLCDACSMKVGNMNAYAAMGIINQYAWQWKSGGFGSTPERKALIEEVDSVCAGYREQLIGDGQINPVTGIFWQKNYDGLRDIQSHEIAPMDPLGEKRSAKEIAEQYKDIIDE